MLARTIANAAGATFYEISGPAIFSKWYGESEGILRRLFADASSNAHAPTSPDEAGLTVSGNYGAGTRDAVTAFQRHMTSTSSGSSTGTSAGRSCSPSSAPPAGR